MSMTRALDTETSTKVRKAVARPAASGAPTAMDEDVFANPLSLILTGFGVTLLVVLCVEFSRSADLVAALWAANGLAVAVWLRTSRGRRHDLLFGGVVSVAILLAELMVGNAPLLSVMFTVTNMIEIVAAVLLARRFAPTLNLSSLSGAVRFLLAGGMVAPILSGLAASIPLALLGMGDFLDGFRTWWFGHAIGLIVIGSLGLALTRANLTRLARPRVLAEAVVLLVGLTVVCGLFLFSHRPFAFVVLPVLLLIAVRMRVLGMTVALLIVTVMTIGGSMMGYGPYVESNLSLPHQVLMSQLLVLIGYLPFLLVASLLEERDRLADRARLGQERAEAASAAKSRLLANVAHEIKSPVAGVIGIGELWQTGQLGAVTPAQIEMAEMLVKTARQVETLAHDLLDVARAESGAVKVDLRPTDIPGLLEDVRRAAALRPEARALALNVVCEGGGLVALADSQRMAQVLTNLVGNAMKYGASGGRVVLRAGRVDDRVRIEVVDFGPGLTQQKKAQLFEPFNRLGLERSSIEGHGVGLALAKRLVELQGGAIGVISSPGEGATFWVEIPTA